mmetsp:Transcript_2713/g.6086  ORF Transcript_2713/g.6086 Transcript_2713/m.6086 type:complete len:209 (-) Transcript_2713:229-855(-)
MLRVWHPCSRQRSRQAHQMASGTQSHPRWLPRRRRRLPDFPPLELHRQHGRTREARPPRLRLRRQPLQPRQRRHLCDPAGRLWPLGQAQDRHRPCSSSNHRRSSNRSSRRRSRRRRVRNRLRRRRSLRHRLPFVAWAHPRLQSRRQRLHSKLSHPRRLHRSKGSLNQPRRRLRRATARHLLRHSSRVLLLPAGQSVSCAGARLRLRRS